MRDMVSQRRSMLAFVFFFDTGVYLFRLAIKSTSAPPWEKALQGLAHQVWSETGKPAWGLHRLGRAGAMDMQPAGTVAWARPGPDAGRQEF